MSATVWPGWSFSAATTSGIFSRDALEPSSVLIHSSTGRAPSWASTTLFSAHERARAVVTTRTRDRMDVSLKTTGPALAGP
jgi:hypothetical protein